MEFQEKAGKCYQLVYNSPKEALPLARELVELWPERGIPWFLLAMSLGYSGNPKESLEAINKALEIDPSDPLKWEVKALALGDLGREDELREVVAKVKELREREAKAEAEQQGTTESTGIFQKKKS